jgi:copper chaperone CopZ
MRHFLMAAVLIAAVGVLHVAAQDGKTAVITGPHICCGMCEKSVGAILSKVDGVADVQCDRKKKTVTFTAKDQQAAQSALEAMYKGGFAGTAKFGDKSIALTTTGGGAGKADSLTVKGVHACCGQCVKALQKLFPDATVTVAGKGAQRDVTIAGKDLAASDVLKKLHGAGFNGNVEK